MFPFVFLAVAGAALVNLFTSKNKLDAVWTDAARQLNMRCKLGGIASNPSIHGEYGNVTVHVDTYARNNEHKHTRYTINHREAGPPVEMTGQGPFAPFAKLFGRRDVEVGEPRFDGQVVVNTPHEEAIRAFLTPARQAAVLTIFSTWKRARITHNTIEVESLGAERSVAILVETVQQVAAIAEVLGDSSEVDHALGMQLEGHLGQAVEELHDINERHPNAFTRQLEAEALVEHGDHSAAAEVLAPVFDQDETSALARDIQGWHDVAASPAPVLQPVPTSKAAVSDLGVQAVIDDLFDGNRMSFEIVTRFEEVYVNARVGWQGTVTRVHSYRHDSDFGEGPGQKATVLLGTAGAQSVISNQVHAVVQFPADADVASGNFVRFDGTLLFVDRFARKLYLSSGALT